MDSPRLALVHDWLVGMRGGEKVMESFCRLWPDAAIHTLLADPASLSPLLRSRRLHTTPLQRLPGVTRLYRHLLPLMPLATRSWRVGPVDLVLSTSHCVAKAVPLPTGVPHVCYCHTPMRYAWHMRDVYLERMRPALRPLALFLLRRLRAWDRDAAANVTWFIANSETVRERIADAYSRESTVIHPPVDTDFYTPRPTRRENYYLVVSALVAYKRVDLAIQACRRLRRRLVVIGSGEEAQRLRQLGGAEVTFLGWQSNETIRTHLSRCRALLFPGEEDFGMVPVEANACGTPVIAFGQGGATESVVPLTGTAPTGVWFEEQSVAGLAEAITTFERRRADISPSACRFQALRFSRQTFEQRISDFVHAALSGRPLPITSARPAARQAA